MTLSLVVALTLYISKVSAGEGVQFSVPTSTAPRADYSSCDVHPMSPADPSKVGEYNLTQYWNGPASLCVWPQPCTFNPCDCCYPKDVDPLANYQPPSSNGYDYYGYDIANYPTSDATHCAAYCDSITECVGFVVATDVQGCWLKSAFGNPMVSNRAVYLKPGTVLPPPPATPPPPPPTLPSEPSLPPPPPQESTRTSSISSEPTPYFPFVDPFKESQILLTTSVCRGRCLNSNFKAFGLGFASLVFGIGEGAVESVVGAVEGVWNMVTDPKTFVVNIVHAGAHPEETAKAIADAINGYCFNGGFNQTTALSIGKCIGNAAGQIGMLFVGVGEANDVTVVAKGAEVVGEDAQYAELFKNVPICGVGRRDLLKRSGIACIPSSVAEDVEKGLASSSTAIEKESEITTLGKRVKKPKVKISKEEYAAKKAEKQADQIARETSKAAKNAENAGYKLIPDPVPNGLPTETTFNGESFKIDYSKSFNIKHFNEDRGGLGNSNKNTANQSQI